MRLLKQPKKTIFEILLLVILTLSVSYISTKIGAYVWEHYYAVGVDFWPFYSLIAMSSCIGVFVNRIL
jgi:hypothetical protein